MRDLEQKKTRSRLEELEEQLKRLQLLEARFVLTPRNITFRPSTLLFYSHCCWLHRLSGSFLAGSLCADANVYLFEHATRSVTTHQRTDIDLLYHRLTPPAVMHIYISTLSVLTQGPSECQAGAQRPGNRPKSRFPY